nr:hypothetical protein HmN_000995600 [Hymenolepis microstoma]
MCYNYHSISLKQIVLYNKCKSTVKASAFTRQIVARVESYRKSYPRAERQVPADSVAADSHGCYGSFRFLRVESLFVLRPELHLLGPSFAVRWYISTSVRELSFSILSCRADIHVWICSCISVSLRLLLTRTLIR